MNCTRPAPVSVATVGAIQSVNSAACATIGKMLDASEKYTQEATAVWHANHFAIFMFGRNQHGGEAIGILTEVFAGSGGARTFADGVHAGGEIPNPISRMANIELTENTFPVRYLFRRRMIDSCGPGRYRGGAGMEFALVQHDSPDGGMNYVISGKGADFPMSDGLSGGYPGSPNAYVWLHNNEADKHVRADGRFAQHLDAMPGEHQPVSWGVYPLMDEDALYVRWDGGGGFGDPLERPADEVLDDVKEGITSKQFALDVYGIVLDRTQTLDSDATTARRAAMRDVRAQNSAEEKQYATVVNA